MSQRDRKLLQRFLQRNVGKPTKALFGAAWIGSLPTAVTPDRDRELTRQIQQAAEQLRRFGRPAR